MLEAVSGGTGYLHAMFVCWQGLYPLVCRSAASLIHPNWCEQCPLNHSPFIVDVCYQAAKCSKWLLPCSGCVFVRMYVSACVHVHIIAHLSRDYTPFISLNTVRLHWHCFSRLFQRKSHEMEMTAGFFYTSTGHRVILTFYPECFECCRAEYNKTSCLWLFSYFQSSSGFSFLLSQPQSFICFYSLNSCQTWLIF